MIDPMMQDHTKIPLPMLHKDVAVNGTFRLYEGPMHIKNSEDEATGKGTLDFTLSGTPEVKVYLSCDAFLFPTQPTYALTISLLSQPEPATARFWNLRPSFPAGPTALTGALESTGLTIRELQDNGKSQSMCRLDFQLINFVQYAGFLVTELNTNGEVYAGNRITFSFGKWLFTFDQFKDIVERLDEAKTTKGYTFTHVGRLQRHDDKLFSPDDANKVIEAMYWFLAFVNGRRCGYALLTGYRHMAQPVYQQWSSSFADYANNNSSWFCPFHAVDCFKVSEKFYACWQDETKRDWLRTAINLYLICNDVSTSIQFALANSQVALEMLAWVVFMEENSIMSEGPFNNVPAADKISMLLFWLGVDKAVPAELQELQTAFPNTNGPDATVGIRNLFIHQTKAHRIKYKSLPPYATWQAWSLNLWYIELILLKLIGYDGPYMNRTQNPVGRNFDTLPWTM